MKHDYDALREMLGMGRPGRQVIKDRKGRVLKQPIIKCANPTFTRYMSSVTAQPLNLHTDLHGPICLHLGYSLGPTVPVRAKRGSR